MRHEGVQPDQITYNILLSARAARGLGVEAERDCLQDCHRGRDSLGYNSYVIETFGKLGKLHKVAMLLKELESEGYFPDTSSYDVLIAAHAKSGSITEAMDVFKQMQAAGCVPNASTYSILLNLYGKNERYNDVREPFLEMKESSAEPDATTYNILIRVFGEGGYFKEVVTLFRDLVEKKIDPSPKYGDIQGVNICLRKGRVT